MTTNRARATARHVFVTALLLGIFGNSASAATAPTDNLTINLIRLLVEQHIISKDKADALIQQARQEAAAARARTAQATARPPALPPGTVRVPYIPQIVKRQIESQVKAEVVAQAKAENWASPHSFPDWASPITLDGEIRLRFDRDFFSRSNAPALDFRAANAGPPYDLNTGFAYLDTTEDRDRYWFLGRLDATDRITDTLRATIGVAGGHYAATSYGEAPIQIATSDLFGSGTTADPVWIDRASLSWNAPRLGLTLAGGRLANPFFSSDLVWNEDLAFDGIVAREERQLGRVLRVFATAGGFPIQGTVSSFPANAPMKQPSRDEWLAAAQLGADWTPDLTNRFEIAAAYYDFLNARGKLSDLCTSGTVDTPGQAQLQGCNTDQTRPAFLQKGNTLFPIRELVGVPGVASPTQPEYFGLASDFRELELRFQYDLAAFGTTHLIFDGDVVDNLAYNASRILAAGAFNNRRTLSSGESGPLQSGALAWMAGVALGAKEIREPGDWNIDLSYKYIEPDALLDAFDDYEFHLGGTNAKGFVVGGAYGLFRNTSLGVHYYTADQIFGPPLAIDVLQIDLDARF